MTVNEAGVLAETTIEEIVLWHDLHRLQERYVSVIDTDRLEEWPDLFTEDCVYEIVPKENADRGLPMGLMHYFGRPMLRDRVVALRKANVFAPHTYRHMTSGLEFTRIDIRDRHAVELCCRTDLERWRVAGIPGRSLIRPGRAYGQRLAISTQASGVRHFTGPDPAGHSGVKERRRLADRTIRIPADLSGSLRGARNQVPALRA